MPEIRTISDAEILLASYERPVSKDVYTLETMQSLMDAVGNPQNTVSIIHVAGTSGKTSTAYYAASLLKEAGYKVGLSVSPHIDAVTERSQVNLQNLDEAAYCGYLSEFIDLVTDTNLSPSYFELLVAFSYWVFAVKEQVDVAVIEVGLGGLLDGTNVIDRADKICVITDIGYDHMNILGSTIEEIAAQKAGIIQPGNSVFIHPQDKAILEVIREQAHQKHASVTIVENTTYDDLPLFQQRNFCLAAAAVEEFYAREGGALSEEVKQRASRITIPARMEPVKVGDKTVIFDGSHNDQKIGALVAALRQTYPDTDMTFVTAFTNQRLENAKEGLALLRTLGDSVVVTEFENHQDSRQQSLPATQLAEIAQQAGFSSVLLQRDSKQALEMALHSPSPIVVVTGSFYLLRYVR